MVCDHRRHLLPDRLTSASKTFYCIGGVVVAPNVVVQIPDGTTRVCESKIVVTSLGVPCCVHFMYVRQSPATGFIRELFLF